MSFEQVIGNEEVKNYIRKNLEKNNILHSYLFLGTEGIGKLLLAKELKYIEDQEYHNLSKEVVAIRKMIIKYQSELN